jgi:hypothetical protein
MLQGRPAEEHQRGQEQDLAEVDAVGVVGAGLDQPAQPARVSFPAEQHAEQVDRGDQAEVERDFNGLEGVGRVAGAEPGHAMDGEQEPALAERHRGRRGYQQPAPVAAQPAVHVLVVPGHHPAGDDEQLVVPQLAGAGLVEHPGRHEVLVLQPEQQGFDGQAGAEQLPVVLFGALEQPQEDRVHQVELQ